MIDTDTADGILKGAKSVEQDVVQAWLSMARDRSASHKLTFSRAGHESCSLILLFVPEHLDAEIYAALRPIFDREFGKGSLADHPVDG